MVSDTERGGRRVSVGGIKNTPIHMFYAYGGVLQQGTLADPSGTRWLLRVLMAKDSVHKTTLI